MHQMTCMTKTFSNSDYFYLSSILFHVCTADHDLSTCYAQIADCTVSFMVDSLA